MDFSQIPTTELATTFPSDSLDEKQEDEFLDILGKIYYPCVISTGIIGNIINLVVLSRPSLIKHSSNVYLFGLAIADLLVLVFQVNFKYAVFKAYHVTSPREFLVFLCVYNNWLLIGAVRTSFWITVAFTVDRYIAVAYPLAARRWSTPWKARVTLPFIYLVGFSYGTHALVLREVNENGECVYSTSGQRWRPYFSKLNASAYLVTYILLIMFNGLIIVNVWAQNRRRRQVFPGLPNDPGSAAKAAEDRRRASQNRLTVTLLGVSLLFMILWSPYLVTYMMAQLPNNVGGLSGRDHLALCAEFLPVLNSTVNFFVYNVTNKSFRSQCMCTLSKPKALFMTTATVTMT